MSDHALHPVDVGPHSRSEWLHAKIASLFVIPAVMAVLWAVAEGGGQVIFLIFILAAMVKVFAEVLLWSAWSRVPGATAYRSSARGDSLGRAPLRWFERAWLLGYWCAAAVGPWVLFVLAGSRELAMLVCVGGGLFMASPAMEAAAGTRPRWERQFLTVVAGASWVWSVISLYPGAWAVTAWVIPLAVVMGVMWGFLVRCVRIADVWTHKRTRLDRLLARVGRGLLVAVDRLAARANKADAHRHTVRDNR